MKLNEIHVLYFWLLCNKKYYTIKNIKSIASRSPISGVFIMRAGFVSKKLVLNFISKYETNVK